MVDDIKPRGPPRPAKINDVGVKIWVLRCVCVQRHGRPYYDVALDFFTLRPLNTSSHCWRVHRTV